MRDTRNRLTEVKDNSNNLIARYGYDPMDRRVWKEQYRSRDGNPLAQAKRTCYLYADEGLIAEASQDITLNADQTVTPSGSAQIISQYGPRPNAVFTTGMLFIKTKNSNGLDVFAYYHHDQLGTPVQATDKQGNVVWAASYEPFGKATITTPAATAEKPVISSSLRFPGQMEDAETGLHYNWHRYYDPEVGRYVTQDPIGLDGGDVNLYNYVQNNPVNEIDPEGLERMCDIPPKDCFKKCINDNYGASFDVALALSPFSVRDLAQNAYNSVTEVVAKDTLKSLPLEGAFTNGDIIKKIAASSKAASRAKLLSFLTKGLVGLSKASGLIGAGAGGYVAGAYMYCTVKCAAQ